MKRPPQLLYPKDSILEDEELMKMHVDLAKKKKKVSRYTMCVSQMHGGPSLRVSDMSEGLNIPSGIG